MPPLSDPHVSHAPPPVDDAALADYVVDFLVTNGMPEPAARAEVAGFEPYSLRPTANYAWEVTQAMIEADLYRQRFARLRRITLAAPALFLLGALWFVLAPLIHQAVWIVGNWTIGGLIIAALVTLWRHR